MWSQRSRFSGFIKDTYSSCAGVHHQSLNTQTANLPPDHQLLDYHAANRNAISINYNQTRVVRMLRSSNIKTEKRGCGWPNGHEYV